MADALQKCLSRFPKNRIIETRAKTSHAEALLAGQDVLAIWQPALEKALFTKCFVLSCMAKLSSNANAKCVRYLAPQ